MAEKKTDTVTLPVPAAMSQEQFLQLMSAFAGQITSGIAAGINEARPQKVTAGQYDPKTPFHPNKKTAKKLTRTVYQNGARIQASRLFDREIELLNRITRSGRYLNRLIEVIVRQDGADEVVELRYKNRTIDDRMEHKLAYRDLTDMLTKIVAEQDKLLAEEGQVRESRKSFSTAATREARERAAREAASEQALEP